MSALRLTKKKFHLGPVVAYLPAMLLQNAPVAIVFRIAAAMRSGNYVFWARSTSLLQQMRCEFWKATSTDRI